VKNFKKELIDIVIQKYCNSEIKFGTIKQCFSVLHKFKGQVQCFFNAGCNEVFSP